MKKILVVVDMQNDFITGSLGSDYAKDVVLPNVVKKIKKGDYDEIVLTMDTHETNYLDTFEGKNLPVKHCIIYSQGWLVPFEIEKSITTPYSVVMKDTFGSAKNLPDKIISFEPNKDEIEIEICGFCTDICVISNALILRAYFPNSKIVCDSSCCGGTSKEAHDSALRVMKSCQIEVI